MESVFYLLCPYYITTNYVNASVFYFYFIEPSISLCYTYAKEVIDMKIEKINENQIRCTLTRADLADRQLKLSELAYGTEKAKSLFHDMMQQAAFECGFEANDIPLMIEAVPASADTIVLIITKVEDPDELDTRFSRFAPSEGDMDNDTDSNSEGSEELLNLIDKVKDSISSKAIPKISEDILTEEPSEEAVTDSPSMKMFSFEALDNAITAAHLLDKIYNGSNSLYKDAGAGFYILALTQADHSHDEFNSICNMLSEYGTLEKASGASLAYLEEHCDILISVNAIQQLAKL